MVASPFGRKAMKQGGASRVVVKKGETSRLRFGVLFHAAPPDRELDLAKACRQFLERWQADTPLKAMESDFRLAWLKVPNDCIVPQLPITHGVPRFSCNRR